MGWPLLKNGSSNLIWQVRIENVIHTATAMNCPIQGVNLSILSSLLLSTAVSKAVLKLVNKIDESVCLTKDSKLMDKLFNAFFRILFKLDILLPLRFSAR